MNYDLMQAAMTYVLGQCYLHNANMGTFGTFATFKDKWAEVYPSNSEARRCAQWVERVQTVCWRYLQDPSMTLDGAYSDFECVTAIEVKKLFGE